MLNRVVNYNLRRMIDLISSIEKTKELLYQYEGQIVFSIVRCYYVIFLSRK